VTGGLFIVRKCQSELISRVPVKKGLYFILDALLVAKRRKLDLASPVVTSSTKVYRLQF
jgi:hypothetical protein